jgi:hypothetical protein
MFVQGQNTMLNHCWVQRLWSMVLCAIIGLAVGIIWSYLLGPLTDELASRAFSFSLCTGGLTITGIVVGGIRRFPGCVGAIVGGLSLTIFTIIVGPKDGWIVLWIMILGTAGLLGGSIIGGIFCMFRRRFVDISRNCPEDPKVNLDQFQPTDTLSRTNEERITRTRSKGEFKLESEKEQQKRGMA